MITEQVKQISQLIDQGQRTTSMLQQHSRSYEYMLKNNEQQTAQLAAQTNQITNLMEILCKCPFKAEGRNLQQRENKVITVRRPGQSKAQTLTCPCPP